MLARSGRVPARCLLLLAALMQSACPARAPGTDPHTTPVATPPAGPVATPSGDPAVTAEPSSGPLEPHADAGTDAELVTDISEPYVPEPATPASFKGCPQFAQRLFDWKNVPELVGRSRNDIVSCYGEPADRSADPWRYNRPHGCAYEKQQIEVSFRGDVVESVRARGFVTGEHCDFAF